MYRFLFLERPIFFFTLLALPLFFFFLLLFTFVFFPITWLFIFYLPLNTNTFSLKSIEESWSMVCVYSKMVLIWTKRNLWRWFIYNGNQYSNKNFYFCFCDNMKSFYVKCARTKTILKNNMSDEYIQSVQCHMKLNPYFFCKKFYLQNNLFTVTNIKFLKNREWIVWKSIKFKIIHCLLIHSSLK